MTWRKSTALFWILPYRGPGCTEKKKVNYEQAGGMFSLLGITSKSLLHLVNSFEKGGIVYLY
jgi:hypothetical protein